MIDQNISIRAEILYWEITTTSANSAIIIQLLHWSEILWAKWMACLWETWDDDGFFASSFLIQSRWFHRPYWHALRHRSCMYIPPPGLCCVLWPCLHVSIGETHDNSGDLITKLMWYKNPLEPSLGNTLVHILSDVSSTLSTSSCHIHAAFLQVFSHCGRVMPVRPQDLACMETQLLLSRWKWCEE